MSKSTPNNTNGMEAVSSEPLEEDPCISSKGTSDTSKDKNFFAKFKSEVSEQWGLSETVFYFILGLVVVTVIFLIIIIALAAAFPHVPHSQRFPVCEDSACLRAASQIRDLMNDTAAPCSDLWTWACGGWLSKHPLPKDKSIWNQKQQLIKQEAAKVRDLVTTLRLPLSALTVEWKLKHLFEDCLDVENVNSDEARPLTNIISELEEPPLIKVEEW